MALDDVTAPSDWLNADDDRLAYAQKLAAAMQQRMRGQSLSAAAPDTPVPDDAAASFDSRFGAFGSLAPMLGSNVPLPQPRPASAPDASPLDNLYLSAKTPQAGPVPAPVAAPVLPASPESSPSIGDRATAALANFVAGAHGGGLLGGLLGLGQGAATGQRYDPIGINNQTVQALMQRPGMTPELARAIVSNPAIATQVIPQIFGAKQLEHVTIKDSLNNEIPLTFDPSSGRYRDTGGNVIGSGASNSPGTGLPNPLGAGSAANLPIEIDPRTGRDEKFLAALNPIDRAAVTGVLSGDVNAQGRNMQKYLPYATRAEPGFNQQTYATRLRTMNDFAPQGVSGKNITAINTALGHIQQMYDSTDKLGNFQYFPSLNEPYNAIRGQISPDYQKTVAGFKAAAIGSSGELAKAFRAAGMSEQDIQAWQKQFDENSSPSTIKGSADQALHMLDSRLDSIADSYNRGMNLGAQKTGPDLLSPTARAIHERLIGGGQTAAQPSQAPAQAAAQSPSDVMAQARDAIARGANKTQVILRLQRMGINAGGL